MWLGKLRTAALKLALIPLALTVASSASSFKVIYTFQANGNTQDAALPEGQLLRDAKGNLYGTTVGGGAYGGGTVFELSPNSDGTWSESILHSFTVRSDGGLPVAGLIFDSAGNLYGTTQQGGIYNNQCSTGCGVVFELSPSTNGWTYNLLYSFTGVPDGAFPNGTLVLDAQGNLYGSTGGGGVADLCFEGCGTVFELVRSAGWHENLLHTFTNLLSDGAYPTGGLVFDRKGHLYGATVIGGTVSGYGTVYELIPTSQGTWNETILYNFCSQPGCADGNGPNGSPVLHGGIYGTTLNGGTHGAYGTVFKLVELTKGEHLYEFSFDGVGGSQPVAPVVLQNGKIYGVTTTGGISNGACTLFPQGNGVVFELSQVGGVLTEKVLYSFTGGGDGCGPYGSLISDPAGNLYGTTDQGGSSKVGVVFEITP